MERSEMIDWLKRAIFEREQILTKQTEKGSLLSMMQSSDRKDVEIMRAILDAL